ncbi:hypothetical protein [Dactylosporangium sp. NPDC051484]|uniref:hypothetical protein n=1 Tax=Dactylosporangium sp. NPDC051484 TaxID=3154942 RepID=UPI00344F14B1
MTTTIPIPQPRQARLEGDFDNEGNWYPTQEQWNAAVQQSLDELGLTYEQLACEAAAGEFRSYEARSLWFHIG